MAVRSPNVSVYERKPGQFSVRWREHGKQREERGYTTDAEAHDRATQIRQRLRTGLPGAREPLPVSTLIQQWWDGYVTAGSLGAASRANYRTAARRVLDTIGDADTTTLSTPSLIAWANDLDSILGSPRLVNECLKVLSSAYQRGVEWGTVDTNPVRAVPRRKEPPASVVIPTRAEAAALGITAPTLRERTRLLVAAYTGLRPGEQLALEWRHILEKGIRVEQAMDLRGRIVSTKTGKPRTVPAPAPVLAMLAQLHRETNYPGRRQPVFAGIHGQPLRDSNWRRDHWYPWRQEAGIDLHWRTLRHFYASELASHGATIMQCSRWMGHGTIRTTIDRYAHLFDEDAERVMDRLS